MRRLLILSLLLPAVAACGGNDTSSSADKSTATATATATPTPTPTAAAGSTAGVKVTGKAGEKPEIQVASGATPPAKLVKKDVRTGHGRAAKAGDMVSVQYDGVLYKDGSQFDASWDRGEAFSFTLGQGMVIPGWDQGVAGMKVGGRRLLVIPPDLAYGPSGSGPIGPNETLVFVVDLEKVSS
jgi:peptidylprolyl isomerase